jgi:hypothetical protein
VTTALKRHFLIAESAWLAAGVPALVAARRSSGYGVLGFPGCAFMADQEHGGWFPGWLAHRRVAPGRAWAGAGAVPAPAAASGCQSSEGSWASTAAAFE